MKRRLSVHCSGRRSGKRRRSVGSPLGEGVAAGGSGADAEAVGDRLVGVSSLAHAFSALLFGFRRPEEQDDGEEEDDRPPGEKASHWIVKEVWCRPARALPCRLDQYSTDARG